MLNKFFIPALLIIFYTTLSGCSSLINSAGNNIAKNLALSIQNHNDPATVESALPAYLLMVDSFIIKDPENAEMLRSGAKLYTAYASTFTTEDAERSKTLSQHALDYAFRASCLHEEKLCQLEKMSYAQFSEAVNPLKKDSIESLFMLGQTWAVWIKTHKDDWNAIARLAYVKLLFEKVLALDENYQQGTTHLYMGIMQSMLPASLGGKPEQARQHFEKAIALSKRKNLMALVLYAENYARLTFNQELHDKLLNEVIEADPREPGLTLNNTLAQKKAQQLLESGKDYF